MAKKVLTTIKLQAPGGQASPAPPVGPALGQHGINIMEFVKAFNAQTANDMGTTIPVEITVFEDRSFTFITKTPPAAVLIRQAIGIEKGSGEPNRSKVGTISKDQVRQIAENAGVEGSVVVGKLTESKNSDQGFDAQTETYVDMIKAGIIDPTKVSRTALQNAASVAALMLTTEVLISEFQEDNKPGLVSGRTGT